MSTTSIHGVGHNLSQLLRKLAIQTTSQNTAASTQSANPTGSSTSTDDTHETHGHHHHGHGGGKQLFKQIESAVTSALQALPSDGTGDPNQAIVKAITEVLKNNGISLPSSGTSSSTGQTTGGSTSDTTTTDTTTPSQTQGTTDTQRATPTPPPPDAGSTGSTANADDPDGDGDHDGRHRWKTGNANSATHSTRQAFFQALQKFGITPQQFRQDLLQALKDALNGSPADTTATDPLPPGSAVDVTT